MALCRAEEAGGFAVTAGVAGQSGEAFEDVGDEQVRLDFGGARQRVVGVALGLLRLTRRDRHPGADRERQRQLPAGCSRDGLVGPAAGGGEIPVCQRGLGIPDALQCRRATTHDNHVLAGGLARLVRRRAIPGGQGRESQHYVPEYRAPSAKLRAALKGRLGRRSGRGRLTLVCECHALTPRLVTLHDLVVSRLGLGGHLAELCDGSG